MIDIRYIAVTSVIPYSIQNTSQVLSPTAITIQKCSDIVIQLGRCSTHKRGQPAIKFIYNNIFYVCE